MTIDDQSAVAAAIIGGLGSVAAVLRWAAKAIVKAIDRGYDVIQLNTKAQIDNTAAMVELRGHIAATKEAAERTEAVAERTEAVAQALVDEVSGVHGSAAPNGALADEDEILAGPPRRSPPGGYSVIGRRKTRS